MNARNKIENFSKIETALIVIVKQYQGTEKNRRLQTPIVRYSSKTKFSGRMDYRNLLAKEFYGRR